MKSAPQRGCGSGIAVSLMERTCSRSSVVAEKIIFLLSLWWSAFTAFLWRVSNFSQQRTNGKKPEAECFIGHWKRRGGILGGTWLADQLHQTFFWVYNIISVCLERYRSNMWYRPGQNERMQRSSAPVSNSSCSGFFYFFSKTPCEMPFQQFYIWETKHHTLKVNHEITMQ